MAEAGVAVPGEPIRICASDALPEKGKAMVFEVMQYRQRARAFALRFDGRVVAYLNRCVHVPAEMDWQEGEFLDSGREFILCSIHGAAYDPRNGRCAGGPCGRGALTTLQVEERDGEVYWYPSRDTRPMVPPSVDAPLSAAVPRPAAPDLSPDPLPVSHPVSIAVELPAHVPRPPLEGSE